MCSLHLGRLLYARSSGFHDLGVEAAGEKNQLISERGYSFLPQFSGHVAAKKLAVPVPQAQKYSHKTTSATEGCLDTSACPNPPPPPALSLNSLAGEPPWIEPPGTRPFPHQMGQSGNKERQADTEGGLGGLFLFKFYFIYSGGRN